jgi:hypothetical protein
MSGKVICANRLRDGIVVYLAAGNEWSEWISRSEIARDDVTAEVLLAKARRAEADRIVIDPYLIDVTEIDGEVCPVRYRERIRASGPSVRPDLSKQNRVPGVSGEGA